MTTKVDECIGCGEAFRNVDTGVLCFDCRQALLAARTTMYTTHAHYGVPCTVTRCKGGTT